MKGKRIFLIGIALGALMGWALGFLRLPLVEKSNSFWVGFLACLAAVSFLVSVLYVWNKNNLLLRLIGKNTSDRTAPRTYRGIWIVVSLFVILGGAVSSYLIYRQNEQIQAQIQAQNQRSQEQSKMIESFKRSNLVHLMGNVLDRVDEELKENPERILSDATIARIAAQSYSCKPYHYIDGDSMALNKLSPERGQLLLALSFMEIDSASFAKIKAEVPFEGADLRGADLQGVDLSGCNLKGADFKDADLRRANLSHAFLEEASLWGAKMDSANLRGCVFKRAEMSWVEMNGSDLRKADFDGAKLNNAQLRKVNLAEARLQWAELESAMLNGANLYRTDFEGANLTKANLEKIDLTEGNLMKANLTEANLAGAQFAHTTVREGWMEKLENWKLAEAAAIKRDYEIGPDTSKRYHNGVLCLQKIAH